MNNADTVRRDELCSAVIRAARRYRDASRNIVAQEGDDDALDELEALDEAFRDLEDWSVAQLHGQEG